MERSRDTIAARMRRAAGICAVALATAILMTWPLASGLGHLGRTSNSGDGRFAVWNVAWVAHALTTDPGDLFDANIYHPHRDTLAYSEANVGAGVVAVPVWLLTHNADAAHNSVVLFAFAASLVGTWLLVRRLTGDPWAGAGAAVLFAFCPYVFSHTAHIQLLMIGGLPVCMLLMHRLVDAPSPSAGAALGVALAVQALSCAYYGIFAGLMVGFATLFYALTRRLWRSPTYWTAVAIAAGVSILIVAPFFVPYLRLQGETGFARSLDDARPYSAYWRSYLASGVNAHRWMLPIIKDWNGEALFPGFLAIVAGLIGVAAAWRNPQRRSTKGMPVHRETALLYGTLGVLGLWTSLGPRAGRYTLFFHTIPVFSLLRAPGRTGIVAMLALAVLAAYGMRAIRMRFGARAALAGAVLCAIALIELNALPMDYRPAGPVPASYEVLARLPRGAVAEFPFYDRRIDYHLHTYYMLYSTRHWQPLVNGYSDYIPPDFRTLAPLLASFPSRDAFDALRERRVRYLTLHRDLFGPDTAREVERRLEPYRTYLRPLAEDEQMILYEVIGWPR